MCLLSVKLWPRPAVPVRSQTRRGELGPRTSDIIPKFERPLSRQPSTTLLFQLAAMCSIGSSQKVRAIPAGRLARNFRSRIFRERNVRARYRSLNQPLTLPESWADRDRLPPLFSKSQVAQIAKT